MSRLNLGCGSYRLDGYDNLDASEGWMVEDGLGRYADASVECITVSHLLMYVPLENWKDVFAELARVLAPGGVLRVTEDSTDDRASERYGGYHDAVTLTTASLVMLHMATAGLTANTVSPHTTAFRDDTILQNHHGGRPKAFFVEGVKGSVPKSRKRKTAEPRLTCIIPTVGRPSLGKAIMSARDADEILVMPNEHGDRGYRARNEAMERATGTHLIFLDDDDVYAPGAIGHFRDAARQNPDKLTIFRMRYHHGAVLWNEPWLAFGRIGTPMLLVPNLPGRIGTWHPHDGSNTGGDFVFASETVESLGEPVWREEIVALIRPS